MKELNNPDQGDRHGVIKYFGIITSLPLLFVSFADQ